MLTAPGVNFDVRAAAYRLLRGLSDRPWGEISPSVYETARLVSIAPWLRGHSDRVSYLINSQRDTGGWGQPDGYDLVPTLSATEAALAVMLRGENAPPRLVGAANQGLRWLARQLDGPGTVTVLPDTPAIEIIVPALVAAINAHLDRIREAPTPGLTSWAPLRLSVPAGLSDHPIEEIRSLLHSGLPIPAKLLHSLEVAAPFSSASQVAVTKPGTVGASPAATAAWLAPIDPAHRDRAALRYLEDVVDTHYGAAPSVIPISVFERAWVLTSLAEASIAAPAQMIRELQACLGPRGTPGGAGLPPDADTTSVVLAVLERFGTQPKLDCLMEYNSGDYFYTWPGERTPSVSTNAHVLDVLGGRLAVDPREERRYGAVHARAVEWLCGQQRSEGSWIDKWHASPLYPTACSVAALTRLGGAAGPAASSALRRAVRWVLETQRADGSWGRWAGTREETAYGVLVLLDARDSGVSDHPSLPLALAAGRAFLLEVCHRDDDAYLWHDKDLYVPGAVVRATVLAALHRSKPHTAASALP